MLGSRLPLTYSPRDRDYHIGDIPSCALVVTRLSVGLPCKLIFWMLDTICAIEVMNEDEDFPMLSHFWCKFYWIFIRTEMLMQALQNSSLTCLVDDPKMTESMGKLLLQVQSGLSQDSFQTELACPKGSVLLSTNSKETERYFFHFVFQISFLFQNWLQGNNTIVLPTMIVHCMSK